MVDQQDKKILFELLQDSRQSLNQLSKKVGLSSQLIAYRIQALEKQKIIKKYSVDINYAKLGYSRHSLYLDLRSISSEQVNKYLRMVTDLDETSCCYMLHAVSEWKMYISIWTKTISRFDEIQTKIMSKFRKYIKNYISFQSVKSYTFFVSRLLNPGKPVKCDIKGDPENIPIKKLDWKIINLLKKDAKISIQDIATKFKINYKTITRRMNYLKKKQIIQRFYVILDLNKLGYREYTFLSRVNPAHKKEIDAFLEYALSDPNFAIVIKAVGYINLYYAFYAKDSEELAKITHKIDKILGKTSLYTSKIEVEEMIS
jgi:DNA-binding Lrp family transcriptional regulator